MANETEIERLVVRLVGDDSSYHDMMTRAATSTGELTQVSNEVEHAQESVDSSLVQSTTSLDRFNTGGRGAARSMNFLGMQTMRAGMLISNINSPIGNAVLSLGSMASATGQAMRGFRAMQTAGGFLGTLLAPQVLLPAVAATAAVAVGMQAWRSETKQLEKDLASFDSWLKYVNQGILVYQGTLKGMADVSGVVYTRFSGKSQGSYDVSYRKSTDSQKVSYAKSLQGQYNSVAAEAQTAYKIMEEAQQRLLRSQAEPNESIASLFEWKRQRAEREKLKEAVKEAEEKFKSAEHERLIVEAQAKKAYSEGVEAANRLRTKGTGDAARLQHDAINESFNNQARDAVTAQGAVGKYNEELARYIAVQKAIAEGKSPKQAADLGDMAVRTHELQVAEALKNANEASMSAQIKLGDAAEEMLDPLNQELKIHNALIQARLEYRDANHRDMSVEMDADTERVLRSEQHNKLLQESIQLYKQFQDPLDRIIEDEKRINQLWEAGGFKGDRKAFDRAKAEAYGQAHKQWQSQFQGQQYDTLVGGTSATERALYEYKLGSTAIPDKEKTEEKQMVALLQELVVQGKTDNVGQIEFLLANL